LPFFPDPHTTAPTRCNFRPSDHPMVAFTQEHKCTDGSTDARIFAPSVHLTLVFLHRRFIRRYTDALVPPVITVRRRLSSLTLTRAARAFPRHPPPVRRPSPPPATIRARKLLCRPSAAPPCPPPAAVPLHHAKSHAPPPHPS
jgi:hypothetical protein